MYEFFTGLLSWQNFAIDIVYTVMLAGLVRAMVWLFRVPLQGSRRELVYWLVVPAFLLMITVLGTSLSKVRDYQAREPELKGEIDLVGVGTPPEIIHGSGIIIIASIRNLGTPTIVERWSLSIHVPGGQSFFPSLYYIPDQILTSGQKGSQATLFGRDALYNKTLPTPLPTGGMQRGVLLFILERVATTSVYRPGTQFVLTYKDILGRSYSIEKRLTGKEMDLPYFPGLVSPSQR